MGIELMPDKPLPYWVMNTNNNIQLLYGKKSTIQALNMVSLYWGVP